MPTEVKFDRLALEREIAAPSRITIPPALKFAGLGVSVYAAALVATLPARTVLQWAGAKALAADASGTAWNGRVGLGHGVAASWRMTPFRSLGQLAVSSDLKIDGPGTALIGRTRWRPGMIAIDDVAGKTSWPLVAALAPKFPLSCDVGIGVEFRRIVIAGRRSGADGQMTSGAGVCRGIDGAAAPVPALTAVATFDAPGSRAWLSPVGSSSTHFAEGSLDAEGTLRAALLPAGSALFPPGAVPGGVTFETKL